MYVKETVCETHRVSGSSMAPTLSAQFNTMGRKDNVLVWKRQAAREARRGDIIAFASPYHPEVVSIKRIIATGGDLVYPDSRYPLDEVRVPWGHVWVEGDNQRESLDSNDYGPVGSRPRRV
jgi:mitochondrial inner membrane protease subunit 2